MGDLHTIYDTSQDRQPVPRHSLYGMTGNEHFLPPPTKDRVGQALREKALAPITDVRLFLSALDADTPPTTRVD